MSRSATGSTRFAGGEDVLGFEVQAALIIWVPEALAFALLAADADGLCIVALCGNVARELYILL